jgi:hypothetical protein
VRLILFSVFMLVVSFAKADVQSTQGTLKNLTIQTSFSRGEIFCTANDCMKVGWTAYGPGFRADTYCYRGGCDYDGWSVRGTDGGWSDIRCVDRGCFQDGWYERTNGYDFRIVCNRGDCLTYGWYVMGLNVNFSADVSCSHFSCRQEGWTYRSTQGQYSEVICKDSSCWEYGWNIR